MSLNSFQLHNPTTLKQAIAFLNAQDVNNEKVRILAGGQDLLTEMKEHIVSPETLVNLKHIPGLDKLTADAKGLSIGALVTVGAVAAHPGIRKNFRALEQAAAVVASPQIRNMGTMGGNLCQRPRCWYYRNEHIICKKKGGEHCYAVTGENKYNAILGGGPSWIVHPSDTAVALVALNARVTISGPKGDREVPIEQFFILPNVDARHENILKPNEILTRITIPTSPLAARSVYLKFRERTSMDWAMSACAVALQVANGKVTDARIVLGGVAPIPWRVPKAEALLKGKAVTDETLNAVAEAALEGALGLTNNAYKIPLTKTLVRRAIRQAAA
jgi:xanthine dehydrogenase YagS FAD-binding subunit